jgi:YD repeat-containing protein
MTSTEVAVKQGKDAAEGLIKKDAGAFEKFHNELGVLHKEDAASKSKTHLAQKELKSATDTLVANNYLPKVEITDGVQKGKKFELVGTTADTKDPKQKEIVIAVGRKADGHAESVVVLGRDGKFHESEAVKDAKGAVIGYKRKAAGETYENKEQLATKYGAGDSKTEVKPVSKSEVKPVTQSEVKPVIQSEQVDGNKVFHVKHTDGKEVKLTYDPAEARIANFTLPDGTTFTHDSTFNDYRSPTGFQKYPKPFVSVQVNPHNGDVTCRERNGDDVVFHGNGSVERKPVNKSASKK